MFKVDSRFLKRSRLIIDRHKKSKQSLQVLKEKITLST